MIKCHEQTNMVQTYIHRHPVNKRGNVQMGWNRKMLYSDVHSRARLYKVVHSQTRLYNAVKGIPPRLYITPLIHWVPMNICLYRNSLFVTFDHNTPDLYSHFS